MLTNVRTDDSKRAVFAALELVLGRRREGVVQRQDALKCSQEDKKSRRAARAGEGGVSAELQEDLTARRETLTPHRVVFGRGSEDKTTGQGLFVSRQEGLTRPHDSLASALVLLKVDQEDSKTRQEGTGPRQEGEMDRQEILEGRPDDLTCHQALGALVRVLLAARSEVLMLRCAPLERSQELSIRQRESMKALRENKQALRGRPAPLSFLVDCRPARCP